MSRDNIKRLNREAKRANKKAAHKGRKLSGESFAKKHGFEV